MNLKENSVAQTLEKKLGSEWIVKRSGPGGSTISYIEGWKAIQIANEIFGYNGWNHSVMDITVDYVDVDGTKVSCGISAIVRVTLRDGTYHEDIGYGSIENARTKGMAFEKAKKEAVTDGLKRALKAFGNATGNCLYDKNYLKKIQRMPAINDQELKVEDLYHSSSAAASASGFTKSVPTVNASNAANVSVSVPAAPHVMPISLPVPVSVTTPIAPITAPVSNPKPFGCKVAIAVNNNGSTTNCKSSYIRQKNHSVVTPAAEKSFTRSFSCTDVSTSSSKSFDEDAFLIAADLETMDMSLLEFEGYLLYIKN